MHLNIYLVNVLVRTINYVQFKMIFYKKVYMIIIFGFYQLL